MMIAPGEERGPRGRTNSDDVKPGIAQTLGRQLVEHGGLRHAAKGAHGAEAHIVEQDQNHIGRAARGRRAAGPVGCGVICHPADLAPKFVVTRRRGRCDSGRDGLRAGGEENEEDGGQE